MAQINATQACLIDHCHSPQVDIQARTGALFFTIILQSMPPLMGIVHTFPAEQAVASRETGNGMYSITAYFVSKSFSEIPLQVSRLYSFDLENFDGIPHVVALSLHSTQIANLANPIKISKMTQKVCRKI